MKTLVIGESGQLGLSIKKLVCDKDLRNNFFFSSRSELDFNNLASINDYFSKHEFDVIVNCVAYTNVDGAESEIDFATQINHIAVEHLAKIAFKKNIKFIHISTDYVFSGDLNLPYVESDKTCPLNAYGKTKLAGEEAIIRYLPNNGIIIRTSWLYSEFRKNFVKTIIKLSKERSEIKIVADQVSSPTYSTDLAAVIIQIIQNDIFQKYDSKTQIYHYANNGSCSWYEFATKISEFSNIRCDINPINSIDYSRAAEIPKKTIMSKKKIEHILNIDIPYWENSLRECIKAIGLK
jgi:dTDP-4-dehydrorhamnose reductase